MEMGQFMHVLDVGVDRYNYSLALTEVLDFKKKFILNVRVDKIRQPYLFLE